MGCGCGKEEKKQIDVNKLITMQNLWRRKKAIRARNAMREEKLKSIFSNTYQSYS